MYSTFNTILLLKLECIFIVVFLGYKYVTNIRNNGILKFHDFWGTVA